MASDTEDRENSYRISDVEIFTIVRDEFEKVISALKHSGELSSGVDPSRALIAQPRDPSHGDFASNIAMVLAKETNRKPRELAETIAQGLSRGGLIEKVDVAGPGFINLTLKPAAWTTALRNAVEAGVQYGRNNFGDGKPVNVEYVSANPTGPMHVGHARGAVFGDALSNLLKFTGHVVTREYYINDAGAQVDALARSVFFRYREALGEDVGAIPDGLYPGDYLKPVGELIAKNFGDVLKNQPEAEWLPMVRAVALQAMMISIREDLAAIGISQDRFFSEQSLIYQEELGVNSIDFVGKTIEWLREHGLVYEGRLPPPKGGGPIDDWEDREQTLFRSTAFGDDVDRPLKKSDGTYTYFASDIAYHANKIGRGFRTLIDVWGADHGGYIKRMKAAVAALSDGKAELDIKLIQLVKLLRGGEPVKMSKRAGEFVTLREVVDEVGRDAVRFMMLFRKNDAVLDFDLAKVVDQSRDNPVFYVQYAHARCYSVFRNAKEAFPQLNFPENEASLLQIANLELLSDLAELSLLRLIAQYPRRIHAAAAAHEPHRIAFYLFDLASEFHALWTLGNTAPHLRFIIHNDRQMTLARLALVQGVATVLASGLALLGVGAPNEMR
jgi:arginyl-tRNA synthetase